MSMVNITGSVSEIHVQLDSLRRNIEDKIRIKENWEKKNASVNRLPPGTAHEDLRLRSTKTIESRRAGASES
jgi:hypothetical protein